MSNGTATPDEDAEKPKNVALRPTDAAMPTASPGPLLVQKSAELLIGPRGLAPENVEALWRIAEVASRSGVFPVVAQDPNKAFVLMAVGSELGFSPFRALSAVVLVGGKPTLPGEAALALIRSKLVLEPGTDVTKTYDGEGDSYGCRVGLHRKGQKVPFIDRFSVAEAKQAHLWGKKTSNGGDTPWTLYPDAMLFWRALGRIVREHFSDVTMGLYLSEEMRDVEPAPAADGGSVRVPATIQPDPLLAAVLTVQAEETTT